MVKGRKTASARDRQRLDIKWTVKPAVKENRVTGENKETTVIKWRERERPEV